MKKNVFRVIALILVAGMLFCFSSCKQEILIRFVNENGEDLDLSMIGAGAGNGSANTNTGTDTPAPVDPAPVDDTTVASTPTDSTTAASTPTETPTTPAAPTSGAPSTTADIVAFYQKGVKAIKTSGAAGYVKKEWQVLDSINVGGSLVNSAIMKLADSFMTPEGKAEDQNCAKGSDDAKGRFPDWNLTDLTKVASATCTPDGENYKIKIVMVDEDTPKKSGSILGSVTNSVLYWEDIDDTLKNNSIVNVVLKSYDGIHVNYKGFTIEATMTKDGKFVALNHTANVDIKIGTAKLVVGSIENKDGHLVNYCTYRNFQY